ncbi:hypothetical protein SAMN05192588_1590 [Nonlabens sp. Hel1_33_55]|uniref:hypothetical protein n=1 Tax=Nonlabens sp. Hel1_33_55 TaxID=1336802 RepID=UPI000875EBA1|nr:hypothetical protein [Nonlabens sp. Hel1_33_55]SCY19061.1 hypothetical protein SAMN05192588_1590 [Nonlabens sp. Hel1_33_55]
MELENQSTLENEVFILKIERLSKLRPSKFKELRGSFTKMKNLNENKRNNGRKIIIKRNSKYARLKIKPSPIQILDICEMIEYKYPTLSLEEFHYALKHARWRTFDEEVNHYGYFDATYIADVLKAYGNWIKKIRCH